MNTNLLLTINGWAGRNPLLDTFMVLCAKYLVYLVFALVVVFLGYWLYKRQWRHAAYFFATLVVSFVLLKLASLLNVDHRPFMDHQLTQLISHAPGKSFPSDHTTVTAAIGAGFLFLTRFKKLGVSLLLAALLIGFSRIFVGIHYPADIAGGLIVGLLGAAIVWASRRLFDKTSSRTTVGVRSID